MYKHIIQNILLIVVHVKLKIFVLLIDYLVRATNNKKYSTIHYLYK